MNASGLANEAEPANGTEPARPALLLLNFGGPRTLEEVGDFLYEILRDPETIRLPCPQWVQNLLARKIARRRTPEIARQYREIGGRSPIVEATGRIRNALSEMLVEQGAPLPIYIAHRYLPGDTAQTVDEMLADGVDDILALPLYPHFSYSTSGSSFRQLRELLIRAGWEGRLSALRSYPDAPGYLDALCARLEECLSSAALEPEGTVILCSAHGLPRAYVEKGDPYVDELSRTLERLRTRFPRWRIEISYQSRVGPAEWLKPYTDRIVPEYARAGVRNLVFVPISFVNDHIETLYEVGATYFSLARKHGMTPHRTAAVEDHPGHIRVLAAAARDWRAGWGGVPLEELLPPSQSFARLGVWAWALWLAALLAALWIAPV